MSTTDRVLIINEPFVPDFCRTQRWAARTRGRVLRAPDWLAYATAVLEQSGVDVRLYDFPAKHWEKDRLFTLTQEQKPAVVVLDSTTPSIYSDIDCARLIKRACAETKVLMVGPHVSALPEESLKTADGSVDAVAIGEYDHTVRDVTHAWLNDTPLNSVLGLAYRYESGEIHRNPPRPLIENLDELPFPAWHHLDLWDYFDGGKLYPYITVIGGRGCPFGCSFCLWPQVMHGKRYRFRSPENIVAEIKWVLEKWPKARKGEFFFEDDAFTVNKNRAHALCDAFEKNKLGITFSINSRADCVDKELMRHLKSAGCRMLLVGFESGSQRMLDNMGKKTNLRQMEKFTRVAVGAKLDVHGCFVLGLPGETKESMQETLDFALRLPLTTLQFSNAVPFPGTRYFEEAKAAGVLLAKDWDEWLSDGEQSPVVDYPGLKRGEVEEYVDRGLKQFYFRPSYMIKFLLRTRSKQDLYRKFRGFYNFMTYLLRR